LNGQRAGSAYSVLHESPTRLSGETWFGWLEAAKVVRRPVDLLAGSRLPFAIDRDPRA